MDRKKGDLYRFREQLRISKGAPNNIFSLVSHFIDEDDKQEKLVLRDSGTLDALIAVASDMEKVSTATFEDKLLSCLTDIGESLRMIAQSSTLSIEFEDEEEAEAPPSPEQAQKRKKNVH